MHLEKILKDIQQKEYSAFFYTPNYYKNAESFLFENPEEVVIAHKNDFREKLEVVDKLHHSDMQGYGLISFESGYLMEEKLADLYKTDNPAFIFCFFKKENIRKIKSDDLVISSEDFDEYQIRNFRLNTSKQDYIEAVKKIKKHIKAGDTYQANYTVNARYDFTGNLSSLFKTLIFNQSAEFCAFINLNDKIIMSVSPELFFETEGNQITARPMKGTNRRGYNSESDNRLKEELKESVKDRAENIMIVDLLRNDLGILSNYDSVKGSELYNIQKYESVFQMVSTIKAELRNNSLTNILQNIFPCGSVTGAPKIRTMQIIKEIEKENRGIYTGSIGLIKGNKSIFNVAIRTTEINKSTGEGIIGLGSGIVWDSNADYEYEECLLKSRFLTDPDKYFTIFESVLVENGEIFLMDHHFERLKKTAGFFLFKYDEKNIKAQIDKELSLIQNNKKYKMKIALDKWGNITFDIAVVNDEIRPWKLIVSDVRIDSQNKFQYHKTSSRWLYETEFAKYSGKGFDDVLFINEKGFVAECARTNIFIESGNKNITPPVEAGILNGCFRQNYISNTDNVIEKYFKIEELLRADRIFVTNSVRKIVKVSAVEYNGKLTRIKM